jgi:hypothetical protein
MKKHKDYNIENHVVLYGCETWFLPLEKEEVAEKNIWTWRRKQQKDGRNCIIKSFRICTVPNIIRVTHITKNYYFPVVTA